MNKRILVSESEKNSILNMHKSYKSNGFISEQKKLTLSDLHDGEAYPISKGPDGNLIISTEDNYDIKIGKGEVDPKDEMVIISTENGKRIIKGKNSGKVYKKI